MRYVFVSSCALSDMTLQWTQSGVKAGDINKDVVHGGKLNQSGKTAGTDFREQLNSRSAG